MKIAYLITAYGNYTHLRSLVAALQDSDRNRSYSQSRNHFFIHIDAKCPAPDLGDPGNVTILRRHKVWWGGWSHTEAILDLMREAVNHPGDFDYCSIMSGADYPIRSNAELEHFLAAGDSEYINLREGFHHDKPEKRVKYYYFDGFDRRSASPKALFMRVLELCLRLFARKRHYPFDKIYTGTVWSMLSGGCVRHIVDYIAARPGYVRFFRTALIPEEFFFHTIIGNSQFRSRVRPSLTYADWSDTESSGPARITLEHLDIFASENLDNRLPKTPGWFFARKFDDDSGEVIEAIEQRFRR